MSTKNQSQFQRAKKSLGQHFLKDKNVSLRIVELLDIEESDYVLEIGPGRGALTEHIVQKKPKKLCLIEKDYALGEMHKEDLPKILDNVEVKCIDALSFPWGEIDEEVKLISNLPYNVASPLMWDMLSSVPRWTRAVFMVQKEVALRLVAKKNTKDYGGLSVWLQSYADISLKFCVGPKAFSPPPKVDSAIVLCTPKNKEDLPKDPKALADFIKICFQMRRKQLQAILRKSGFPGAKEQLESLGFEPSLRPEDLSVEDFMQLASAFSLYTSRPSR